MHTCIDDFIKEKNILIDNGRYDLFLNDAENRNTIGLLNYTPKAMLQEIRDLEACDLHEGPVPDDNKSYGGEVWIFKKVVRSIRLYIKLKIRIRNGKEVFVMSFHPDR